MGCSTECPPGCQYCRTMTTHREGGCPIWLHIAVGTSTCRHGQINTTLPAGMWHIHACSLVWHSPATHSAAAVPGLAFMVCPELCCISICCIAAAPAAAPAACMGPSHADTVMQVARPADSSRCVMLGSLWSCTPSVQQCCGLTGGCCCCCVRCILHAAGGLGTC